MIAGIPSKDVRTYISVCLCSFMTISCVRPRLSGTASASTREPFGGTSDSYFGITLTDDIP